MREQLLKMFDLLLAKERPLLERAILVSTLAHSGQVDKGKKSYILHPLTVGLNPLLQSDEEKSVGILHDVVEDTDLTISDLEQYFPKEVTEALKLLTHEDGVDYFDYIELIASSGNRIAVKVKMSDLLHNSQLERLPYPPTEKDWKRKAKYDKALEILRSKTIFE